jgi:hypothetical protein
VRPLAFVRRKRDNAHKGKRRGPGRRRRTTKEVGMTSAAYSGARADARPMAGWIVFAATMMMVIGAIDFIEGLIAVIRDHYYVLGPNQIIIFDMTTWGWLMLIWGLVLFLAGMALWAGQGWARWFTVVACSINVLAQLSWLGSAAYPLWTLTAIALNVVVVYALTVRWAGYTDAIG